MKASVINYIGLLFVCFICIEYRLMLKFKINMNSDIESSRLIFIFFCDVITQLIT